MPKKKLKAIDPTNTNKASRQNYDRLMNGGDHFDQPVRRLDDGRRLTGAAGRFAAQLAISKKLEQRDKFNIKAKDKNGTAGHGAQPVKLDYKQALQAQAAAARMAEKQRREKEERRKQQRAEREQAAAAAAASAAADAGESSIAEPAQAEATLDSDKTVVSLSRSIEEQRAARKAAQAARRASKEDAAADDDDANDEDEAESDNNADDAAASSLSTPAAPQTISARDLFSTQMRPGESFRSYQQRLLREKAEKMAMEVKIRKLSEKNKRKLAEREAKKKARRDPSLDPAELAVAAEREAKERRDREREEAEKNGKGKNKGKGGHKRVHPSDAPDTEAVVSSPPKRPRSSAPADFAPKEHVAFGEVVERPPTLSVLPKSRTLNAHSAASTNASTVQDKARIIDSLLLLKPSGKKKKGQQMSERDAEAEKARLEWAAQQRRVAEADAAAAADARQREIEQLREQSLAAYKRSKLKRKAEEMEPTASASSAASKPVINRRQLKKKQRHQQRMKTFKENLEMEMALGIDVDAEVA